MKSLRRMTYEHPELEQVRPEHVYAWMRLTGVTLPVRVELTPEGWVSAWEVVLLN